MRLNSGRWRSNGRGRHLDCCGHDCEFPEFVFGTEASVSVQCRGLRGVDVDAMRCDERVQGCDASRLLSWIAERARDSPHLPLVNIGAHRFSERRRPPHLKVILGLATTETTPPRQPLHQSTN